jgi:ZIP family zinc transporter
MVLAWGTSAEEVIEGVAIGVGVALGGSLGPLLALAIAIDNLSEAFSIGTLIRDEAKGRPAAEAHLSRGIFIWSAAPGVSVFVSSLLGWALFRGLSNGTLAALLAIGAGSLFYLTVTDFIPEAEERHYQQSAALAVAAGFLVMYVLSSRF